MNADARDELAIELFRLIRDDLAREYGLALALLDNLQSLKVVIRSRPLDGDTNPRYRIAVAFKPSRISIIRKQTGHRAGEPRRIDLIYDNITELGERSRDLIIALISDERLRQIDYRNSTP